MNHEFKPGDLAMIKICRSIPEMVGKCVELHLRLEANQQVWFGGLLWLADGVPAWIVSGEGLSRLTVDDKAISSPFAFLGEFQLMPLRGDEDPDATLATERPADLVSA
jgi:hypothetical protein